MTTAAAGRDQRLVRVERPSPDVLELTLARPERRNALSRETLDELAAALRDADARCLILRGEGGSFSAGYDLKEAAAVPVGDAAERFVVPVRHEAFDLLEAGPIPSVAALRGTVAGGGLELALACDLRIAASDTCLSVPAGRLGLVYSHTGIQRILGACGPALTHELLLFGREVDAARAAGLGLVAEVVDSDDLDRRARQIAVGLGERRPEATAANKRTLAALVRAERELDRELADELIARREAGLGAAEFERGLRDFCGRHPGGAS